MSDWVSESLALVKARNLREVAPFKALLLSWNALWLENQRLSAARAGRHMIATEQGSTAAATELAISQRAKIASLTEDVQVLQSHLMQSKLHLTEQKTAYSVLQHDLALITAELLACRVAREQAETSQRATQNENEHLLRELLLSKGSAAAQVSTAVLLRCCSNSLPCTYGVLGV